jgi:hypothetical protein
MHDAEKYFGGAGGVGNSLFEENPMVIGRNARGKAVLEVGKNGVKPTVGWGFCGKSGRLKLKTKMRKCRNETRMRVLTGWERVFMSVKPGQTRSNRNSSLGGVARAEFSGRIPRLDS